MHYYFLNARQYGRIAICGIAISLGACRSEQKPTAASSRPAIQRIISISPDATEMIGALGRTDRLVAVSTFCLWPPEVKKLPRVGGLFDANPETILNLRPDLIVLRGANKPVETLARDRNIALYRDHTERLKDIYSTLNELGEMLDCKEQAVATCRTMQAKLDRIAAAVAGKKRPRVLMTLARRPDALGDIMTGNRETFLHDIITIAGGENAFAGMSMDYPRLSPEAILTARPEVIIEAMPETRRSETLETSLRDQWKKLGPIPAVESGRIYVMTDENCLIPSPRIVEVAAKLAKLLHPEATID